MTTPIARIMLAFEAHMEYLEKTSVLRGGPAIENKPGDPASKIKGIFGGKVK